MIEKGNKGKKSNLDELGLKNCTINWNLDPKELQRISLERNQAQLTSTGAINIKTGEFTGRSPKDRFIVKDKLTKDNIWWGDINIGFNEEKFDELLKKMVTYISGKELFVRDAYACADEKYRMNIRVINEYAWSNLFSYNMFLRPTLTEIENFIPEFTIINIPSFMAIHERDGTRSHNFSILNVSKKIILIGGTG